MDRKSHLALLAFALACTALLTAAGNSQQPHFMLQEVQDGSAGIDRLADWRAERVISGIGWELATASRGGGSVMDGGLTVVQLTNAAKLSGKKHLKPGVPVSFKHCYVLAAFDLLPSGYLLVTVRDPQHYWAEYDYKQGVVDPVELVWYDESWQEQQNIPLDYAAGEYPDDFMLSPDQRTLLALKHPVDVDGEPSADGQSVNIIYLFDGSINDVLLPDADGMGALPPAWQPVGMQWDARGYLEVQAGKQIRRYEVKWD